MGQVFTPLGMVYDNSIANTHLSLFIVSITDNGARCSSMVRAFAHGVMGHQIDPSWWTQPVSRSSQCSTTGVTKAVVCVILAVG